MTEREPFAKVVRKPNLHGIDAYLVACDGHPVEVDGDPVSAYIAAELTNDAHEARVKEAVREAMEEFRERAARICEDSVKWYPRGNISECTKTPHELAAEIRALTTEWKGK